jgi:hypothetical protein
MEYKESYKSRIYSDLKNLSYKTNELLKWEKSKVSYSDYFDFYKDIKEYFIRLNFPKSETNELILTLPNLIKPNLLTYNNCPIWMISVAGIFNIYIFLIFISVLAPIGIPLIIFRIILIKRIKKQLGLILEISNCLQFNQNFMI